MWVHVLGQALLIFELWIFGMELRAVSILTVCRAIDCGHSSRVAASY